MGKETRKMLAAEWDYVVLQDQSQTPGGGRNTDSGLGPGVAKAEAEASLRGFYAHELKKATPVLFSTWGRHDGDPANADVYGTFLEMNGATGRGYEAYAAVLREAGVAEAPVVVPCGLAFEIVFNDTADPLSNTSIFSCLYHHSAPADGGLVEREPSSYECVLDGAGLGGHPSPLGTYLIACTFLAVLLGQSPVGIAWAPDGVSEAHRRYAQEVAVRAAEIHSGQGRPSIWS